MNEEGWGMVSSLLFNWADKSAQPFTNLSLPCYHFLYGRFPRRPRPPPADSSRYYTLYDPLLLYWLGGDESRARPADRDPHLHRHRRVANHPRLIYPDRQSDTLFSDGDRHPQPHPH